jgi:hypothetical protein
VLPYRFLPPTHACACVHTPPPCLLSSSRSPRIGPQAPLVSKRCDPIIPTQQACVDNPNKSPIHSQGPDPTFQCSEQTRGDPVKDPISSQSPVNTTPQQPITRPDYAERLPVSYSLSIAKLAQLYNCRTTPPLLGPPTPLDGSLELLNPDTLPRYCQEPSCALAQGSSTFPYCKSKDLPSLTARHPSNEPQLGGDSILSSACT